MTRFKMTVLIPTGLPLFPRSFYFVFWNSLIEIKFSEELGLSTCSEESTQFVHILRVGFETLEILNIPLIGQHVFC